MHRRLLLKKFGLVLSAGLSSTFAPRASADSNTEPSGFELATSESDGSLIGYSQGFFEVRHRHSFTIPLPLLVNPPSVGFSARCSKPISGSTDFAGLAKRTDSSGRPVDLSEHAHTVALSQAQLLELSRGHHVTIDLPKFGHRFYFVADDRTVNSIKALRTR